MEHEHTDDCAYAALENLLKYEKNITYQLGIKIQELEDEMSKCVECGYGVTRD